MRRLLMTVLALGILTPGLAFADHHEEVPAAEAAPAEEAPAADVAEASGEKVHSINPDLFGLVNGSYRLNYVYLMDGTHGFLVEPTLEMNSSGNESYTSYGAIVGYRWHWDGGQDSGFLGVNIGYLTGTGVSTQGGTDYDLTVTSFEMVPNIGWRWAWDFGLNITFRAGIGYGNHSASTSSDDPAAQAGVEALDDLLSFLPVAVDGELSLGWNF